MKILNNLTYKHLQGKTVLIQIHLTCRQRILDCYEMKLNDNLSPIAVPEGVGYIIKLIKCQCQSGNICTSLCCKCNKV